MSTCNQNARTKKQRKCVCYKWESCPNAYRCSNVLRGIRGKLSKERLKGTSK